MPVIKARIGGTWVDVGGVGGGSDEVYVGTSDPIATAPTTELWYDTDAGSALGIDARWNTAWGVIVPQTASSNSATSGTTASTLHTLNANFVAGRRYVVRMGNLGSYGGSLGDNYNLIVLLDGVSIGSNLIGIDVANAYLPPGEFAVQFSTTTGAHTITIQAQRAAGVGSLQARFYAGVEDVGPVVGALPMADPAQPWTAFTPVVQQSATITINNVSSTYTKIGRTVIAVMNVGVTSAGTAGFGFRASLPVPARAANALVGGGGSFYDASTTTRYVCEMVGISTTQIGWGINGVSTDFLGVSPSIALASGDGLHYNITYEADS